MSGFLQLGADLLVAVLLVATIVVSARLSRNITKLKADESAMRSTIAELLVATDTAERAVASLRSTLDETDRSLAERLRAAERCAGDLRTGTMEGEAVLARIDAIISKTRQAVQLRSAAPAAPAVPTRRPGGSALDLAVATAQAVADRAARRMGERAA